MFIKKNRQAINFYLKNGFKITDESIDSETKETQYTMIWLKQNKKQT